MLINFIFRGKLQKSGRIMKICREYLRKEYLAIDAPVILPPITTPAILGSQKRSENKNHEVSF
jgi:hypothetical protein